ncbi:MAG: sigma-70 family RNA polymerase sigma factor [Clostridiales bacterium]|nr:sigma-70 family RNA polymerase sigma factor [Clostridiales bacterium]
MEDENIIRLYWDRDETAIEETSRKYGRYCFAIANNILCSREDSEECVNDTYVKVWESIPPKRPSIFSAFIGKITRNISLNRYKLNNAEKRGGNEMTVVLDEVREIVSGEPDPEEEAIRADLTAAVNDFLSTLSVEKRVMFVRRYWYADDVKSIASRMGTSENNISVSVRRIRNNLRDYLIERGFEL